MMLKLIMLLSNGLAVIEITFIFFLMSSFLLEVDGNKAPGNCTYSEKEHKCCTNYHYVNGTCTQCPKGTYGDNCSAQCPANMYGYLCVKRCKCEENQVCNRVHGCIAEGNNAPGNCTNSNGITECCSNYFYAGGACIKCAKGTFGINCSEQCPKNMYGDLCAEKCDCKVYEQCHHKHGCIDSRGICGNTSYEMICCKNYILKDGYCKESKSHLKTTGLIYWIIPVICGIVIFIFICIYRRSQPKKQRQFVDIPVYQHEMHGNTRDNYDHMADINIIMAKNGKTFEDRKLEATSSASMTREVGTPDEIKDTGEYHTLNLRVFDYEEPIKHEQLKRSQSENSSLYFDNNVSNWKRGSSLRHIRSTNDHIHESDEQKLRERHFVPENYVSKSVNNSEPTFDDFDLNNPTTLERKNMVPPSQLFLNELSSHLFNLKKH